MTARLHVREEPFMEVRELHTTFELDGEDVPGLFYLPKDHPPPWPLVLIQHPGLGSKDDYFVTEPARAWAQMGWAAGGLDAPLHGDRREYDPMRIFRDRERMPVIRAQFARELSMAVDLLAESFEIDLSRLAFVGYSLGSMLGLPAVALDGRFKAAAFYLVGEGLLAGPAAGPDSFASQLGNVAVRIVGKASDELIPRSATESLYDAIPGTRDIVWLPGGHYEIGPDVIRAAGDWLKKHL